MKKKTTMKSASTLQRPLESPDYHYEAALPPHVERMQRELEWVKTRLTAINAFCKSEQAKGANPFKMELLGAQYSAMSAYARTLAIRIKVEIGEIEAKGKKGGR